MTYTDLRTAVKIEQNVDLENPGKIYYKDNYIFIVEELKGIHVYDNTDPASPVKKAFVNLPGVVDISISGYILYADSFVDLVMIDVQNIDNIREVARVKDILPYTVTSTPDDDYPMALVDEEKGVVIDWDLRTIRERIYTEPYPWPIYYRGVLCSLMHQMLQVLLPELVAAEPVSEDQWPDSGLRIKYSTSLIRTH